MLSSPTRDPPALGLAGNAATLPAHGLELLIESRRYNTGSVGSPKAARPPVISFTPLLIWLVLLALP